MRLKLFEKQEVASFNSELGLVQWIDAMNILKWIKSSKLSPIEIGFKGSTLQRKALSVQRGGFGKVTFFFFSHHAAFR